MEKINSRVVIKNSKNNVKAERGTVTIRQRGNSFEARIRLELKKGGDKNPRLSRSGPTEEIARQRLAQLIIDTYVVKQTQMCYSIITLPVTENVWESFPKTAVQSLIDRGMWEAFPE